MDQALDDEKSTVDVRVPSEVVRIIIEFACENGPLWDCIQTRTGVLKWYDAAMDDWTVAALEKELREVLDRM